MRRWSSSNKVVYLNNNKKICETKSQSYLTHVNEKLNNL